MRKAFAKYGLAIREADISVYELPWWDGMHVTVEDLHDHSGPIKNVHTGCALKVACLAWCSMIASSTKFWNSRCSGRQ